MGELRKALSAQNCTAVRTAIRQLAFGAIMCSSDIERAKEELKEEIINALGEGADV